MSKLATITATLLLFTAATTVALAKPKQNVERKGRRLLHKRVKVSATLEDKEGRIRHLSKHGSVTTFVAAGQDCANEGEKAEETQQEAGLCKILGKERPCTCDVTTVFECKDKQYRGVEQRIGSCKVNETVKVPGFGNIPDDVWR